MSALAVLCRARGAVVSGSDIKSSLLLKRLRGQGIRVCLGHGPDNLGRADLVVYSSAVRRDNPELSAARARGVPLMRRAQCLAGLMRGSRPIIVSGCHGKTTTASLAACMLRQAGWDPTAVIGGIVRDWGSNVCIGRGDYFVAEGDESDGTFLEYRPVYSLVTNIESEHMDYYKNYPALLSCFQRFIRRTRPQGCVFAAGDDRDLRRIISRYPLRYVTFGLGADCMLRGVDVEYGEYSLSFGCLYQGRPWGRRFELALPGEHNLRNALAVVALARELGIGEDVVYRSLKGYKGAGRRFEIKSRSREYLVVDDYAHHPTEIRATLSVLRGLRERERYNRVIAIFQPHRYTRTQYLWDDLAGSFSAADHLIITDIYPAGEAAIHGVSSRLLCRRISSFGKACAEFLPRPQIIGRVLKMRRPGDIIVTLGAGDVGELSNELSAGIRD